MISARFDDLRPYRRRSFEMSGPVEILEATSIEEVVKVLAAAEKAVTSGLWVAGFVTYEAAPAFDSALVVIDREGTDFEGLPLAWFSVWKSRVPTQPLDAHIYQLSEWQPEIEQHRHAEGVTAIRKRIEAGDTYQVNHTFRMTASFSGRAEGVYRDLVNSQSCGYGALIDTGRFAIVSASPELFFEWRHGVLRCKPMKGTASRGLMLDDDEEQRRRLSSSEKDRAENLMIVDMVRNDLGRVAQVGSVEVPALFTTEKYDTVWQLTSSVTARPRSGLRLADVFAALFPSASITGAPKVATMQIIAGLEDSPRGIYCGGVGFGGPDAGDQNQWAFNVAIRTVLVDRDREVAVYGTGGGVTFDSTPQGEFQEAVLKAAVLGRRSAVFDLLETIRFTPNEGLFLLDRHLQRLLDSASYFDIPLDPAEVRAALRSAAAAATRPMRVRLLVDRSGVIQVDLAEIPPPTPVSLAIDTVAVDSHDVFLYHKTTNRVVYDEARNRHPKASDVALINNEGEVTETTIANLAVDLDGVWYTPPVGCGLLPGTLRGMLVEQELLQERVMTPMDLKAANRIARVNALRGWEEVSLV
jgi:para-aminobenzoate synthetase / 4-amino-4-deoxychorismate lyase